jgi:hypothetical protein
MQLLSRCRWIKIIFSQTVSGPFILNEWKTAHCSMCKIFLSSPLLFRYFCFYGNDTRLPNYLFLLCSYCCHYCVTFIKHFFFYFWISHWRAYVDTHKHRRSGTHHKLSVLFKLLCDMMTVTCGWFANASVNFLTRISTTFTLCHMNRHVQPYKTMPVSYVI